MNINFIMILGVENLYVEILINVHVKYGTSINEMKNCIYAFINYYDTLKNDLFSEHKTIFTGRIKNTQ
ncbi:Plasmodium exported protein, unknown function [Plasmodium sp. DRC-Itaito]|nr:Plasmodium exported protein, unknown function [Plasmodium sp. DRC-Itaito]